MGARSHGRGQLAMGSGCYMFPLLGADRRSTCQHVSGTSSERKEKEPPTGAHVAQDISLSLS